MKKSVLAMLAAASVLSAFSLNANAATTGNIHFKGAITSAPCTITTDQLNQTVDLGEIPKELVNAGTAPTKTFSIKFENCDFDPRAVSPDNGKGHKQPTFYFSGDADTVDQTQLFTKPATTNGAKNVVLKIETAAGKPVKFSGQKQPTGGTAIQQDNGVQLNIFTPGLQTASADFVVSVNKNGNDVTEGAYTADTQFTIQYQ